MAEDKSEGIPSIATELRNLADNIRNATGVETETNQEPDQTKAEPRALIPGQGAKLNIALDDIIGRSGFGDRVLNLALLDKVVADRRSELAYQTHAINMNNAAFAMFTGRTLDETRLARELEPREAAAESEILQTSKLAKIDYAMLVSVLLKLAEYLEGQEKKS